MIGLNLRMTEQTAALACAQLAKGHDIIAGRRELALEMTDMVKGIPFVDPPNEAVNCKHVYYQWAAKVWGWKRTKFLEVLNGHGLPMRKGYSPLLSDIFGSNESFPVARQMEDRELVTFEICAYEPSKKQLKIMREIFKMAGEK